MAKRKDTEAVTATNAAAEAPATDPAVTASAPPAAETPKIETPKIDAPKIEAPPLQPSAEPLKMETAAEAPKIELPPVELSKITPFRPEPIASASKPFEAAAKPAIAAAATAETPARSHKFALLAASVALAAALGGILGAAATAGLRSDTPTPVADAAAAETRALRETVVRLSTDFATLKSHVDSANRNAATQFQRLGERFERAEKAQAEPAARLAKISETLDRLERRNVAAAAPAVAPATIADITGSISTVDKTQAKPLVLEGWKLHDFYAGRAVLENRSNGNLYEVGPGSNLPGVGKIESIKREDNRIIVVTQKGIITSALVEPPRRPSGYMPYR